MDADSREDVIGAFFDFASQFFEYSAIFALQGDIAEGRSLRLHAHPEQSTRPARRVDRSMSAVLMFGLAMLLGRRTPTRSHGH